MYLRQRPIIIQLRQPISVLPLLSIDQRASCVPSQKGAHVMNALLLLLSDRFEELLVLSERRRGANLAHDERCASEAQSLVSLLLDRIERSCSSAC
jgi:hypothetical protein